LVARDFPSISSNFRPLSNFITYHTYKIKNTSTRNPQKRENIKNQAYSATQRTEISLSPEQGD
jgi:hypothetical protein